MEKFNLNFRRPFKIFELYRNLELGLPVDELIRMEVVPYVRKFGDLSKQIQEESKLRAEHETAFSYLNSLKYWWEKHNELAYKIDEFLVYAMDWKNLKLKTEYLEKALSLYKEAHEVETNKRIYSAGVKIFLDRYIPYAVQKYNLNSGDTILLSTLWELSYWHLSKKWHIKYLLYKRGLNDDFKDFYLKYLNEFHSGDEKLVEERIKTQLKKINQLTNEELISELLEIEKIETNFKDKKVNAFYLCVERSDLKAIREIIRYDNLIEYIFGVNLYGVPDLFLRKGFVNSLINMKLLEKKDSILEYSLGELEKIIANLSNCALVQIKI